MTTIIKTLNNCIKFNVKINAAVQTCSNTLYPNMAGRESDHAYCNCSIDMLPEHAVMSVKVKVIKRAESVKVKFEGYVGSLHFTGMKKRMRKESDMK